MLLQMRIRRRILVTATGLCAGLSLVLPAKSDARLPVIGLAPDFVLIDQAGARLALADLRGKVLALTFIYTACGDTCPIVTAKMALLQGKLGADFGPRVRFVSITVEPEFDTPAALAAYARAQGADLRGWSFLTGPPAQVHDVIRRYGAYARGNRPGDVDHLFLTSLIDRNGMLRVQYLGYRFEPQDMLLDLQALLRE